MRELIAREKARSDRTGSLLSLVLFDITGYNRRELRRFVQTLLPIVRTTDHVGRFSGSSIAVLLPATGNEGASVFVAHVLEQTGRPEIHTRIYTYPDVWLNPQKAAKESEAHSTNGNGNGSVSGNGHGHGHAQGHGQGHAPGTRKLSKRADNAFRHAFTRRVPLWKRVLDIVGASLGLVILSPLLLLVALYIKVVSPGPIIFKQARVGMGRREFTFLKFRTMHVNTDESYHAAHARNFIEGDQTMDKLDEKDPRIIFGGRVLRKACIDELPQLINILRGDMSLVGPRPCIPYEAAEYSRWHSGRFSILPGLTGLWQVSGKNKLTFQEMIRLDITYENRMSLGLDLWIILKTVPAIAQMVMESLGTRLAPGDQNPRHGEA
jgi:lipopolysaccharide/colanic/teichoic acid biosynthesis glycosyltransferase